MEEIILKNKKHGMAALIVIIAIYALAIVGMIFGAAMMEGDGIRFCLSHRSSSS